MSEKSLPLQSPLQKNTEKYNSWTKDQLVTEVLRFRKQKKYGLVWEDKPEDVVERCKTELPVLHDVVTKAISSNADLPINLFIEGDNYHALSVLNYTHKGKIDVIYIDPPYNTGASDWKYNNDYIEAEDPWRHSKWLSMMDKRLRLAKNLLNKKGVLICAIDDYELNTLGLLLDELFPSYERSTIIVEHHPQGAGSITVSRTHEYAYVLTPKGMGIEGKVISAGEDRWSLRRSGQGENNWRENRPNSFFAVIVDAVKGVVVGVGPEIPKEAKKYAMGKTPEGYLRIYPLDRHGGERVWRYNRASMQKLIDEGVIEYTANGSLVVKKNGTTAAPIFSVWKGSRYNAGVGGSNLLTQIMGEANTFPYPKSLYTVVDMLAMILRHKKDAIVLDFFAGSGTTGHAVFELNKEDDGNRRFILCTNNENGIASEVCYPRVAKIMQGYKGPDGKKVAGLGGNLKYFKTAFVGAEPNDKNKEVLTREATEMLCMREDTFELVKETRLIKIFRGSKRHTGIIFDEDAIPALKKEVAKIGGKWGVYIFSLSDDTFDEEFEDMKKTVTVAPIPEAILRVYRRIFQK